MKLLIIDDDLLVCRAAVRALKAKGHEVEYATAPWDVNWTRTFDAALLDWNPHGLHCSVLCEGHGIPYVIYTGRPESVLEGYRVLAKPASADEICEALEAAACRMVEP